MDSEQGPLWPRDWALVSRVYRKSSSSLLLSHFLLSEQLKLMVAKLLLDMNVLRIHTQFSKCRGLLSPASGKDRCFFCHLEPTTQILYFYFLIGKKDLPILTNRRDPGLPQVPPVFSWDTAWVWCASAQSKTRWETFPIPQAQTQLGRKKRWGIGSALWGNLLSFFFFVKALKNRVLFSFRIQWEDWTINPLGIAHV